MRLKEKAMWQVLQQHQKAMSSMHLKDLFAADVNRFNQYSIETQNIFLDYSKNKITEDILSALLQLAQECKVPEQIEALFQGNTQNLTEQRRVLHTFLRQTVYEKACETAHQEKHLIHQVKNEVAKIVNKIRAGQWLGFSGKPISHIVHVGIGGSDLGPRLMIDALQKFRKKNLCFHFISNADGIVLQELLSHLPLETSLFVIASKSFHTLETLYHTNAIKHWLLNGSSNSPCVLERHLLAVTANSEKAKSLGISSHNIFPIWEWIGGRFSIWSNMGLTAAIAIGMEAFNDFLAGAFAMDQHCRYQPLKYNMPVILALLSIWYINFWGVMTHAIIPYAEKLRYFPFYLQQLEMESNGKSVSLDGERIDYATAPMIIGGIGTDAQHSFFQLFHQGTQWLPIDFICVKTPDHSFEVHHQLLLANCLAQSHVLLHGSQSLTQDEIKENNLPTEQATLLKKSQSFSSSSYASHFVLEGNRPSNTLIINELTPFSLGELIALYEHKTIIEGFIWGINSFDQCGVEQGKRLTQHLLDSMQSRKFDLLLDGSTQGLLEKITK